MLLVYLYAFTEFHLAMSIEVQFAIEYDFKWALCFGHVTIEGGHSVPEHNGVYHFYYHDGGKVIKSDYVVVAANLVPHGTVLSVELVVLMCCPFTKPSIMPFPKIAYAPV